MQTPLIKEIYLHTYILYIGWEKFFFAIIGNFSTDYFNVLECNFIYQIFQHGLHVTWYCFPKS